jgi:ParB family chromosome partitioning protein
MDGKTARAARGIADWLLAQETGTVLTLLGYCAACTVNPERGAAVDRLAAAVRLDMTQWWQPTAAYFGRVPNALILEALTEAAGKEEAEHAAKLNKGDMADYAATLSSAPAGYPPCFARPDIR